MAIFTTSSLVLLTLLSLAAAALAIHRLRHEASHAGLQHALVWAVALGSAALFLAQEVFVHRSWQPLVAHVDGLLLIAALLALTIVYLQRKPRLESLGAFALPLVALLLLWAICASYFTYWQFDDLQSVWLRIHLASVYLGTLFSAIAAMAGAMYLYVHRRLRDHRAAPTGEPRFASLETLETLIIRTATLGFAILTLGLVTGLVKAGPEQLRDGGWHHPKIILAFAAWLVYAVVMNVRFTTNFRGARAAWLSIAGLVLLLAAFGVATALPSKEMRSNAQRRHVLVVGRPSHLPSPPAQREGLSPVFSNLPEETR